MLTADLRFILHFSETLEHKFYNLNVGEASIKDARRLINIDE